MTISNIANDTMLFWTATEVFVLLFTRTRRGSGDVQDRGSLHLLWPTIIASIWAGTSYGGHHAHTIGGNRHLLGYAVEALLLVGLAIRWTAIVTLGRSFSANVAIHATQTVKRDGIFRHLRHPSYTGMLLIFLGIGLGTGNWVGLAIVFVPATAALLYRIHVEEQALTRAFGADYLDYSASTRRLIPGVY